MSHRLKFIGTIIALLTGVSSVRADLVSGTVSYNPQTQLYTYSYTVTNPGYTSAQLSIMVGPPVSNTNAIPQPVSTTSPAGWHFGTSVANLDELATYWSWYGNYSGGTPLSGFSFTTSAAPVLSPGTNNYMYTYYPTPKGPGFATPDYGVDNMGQVVAPDLSVVTISSVAAPEPSTFLIGGLGGLLLAFGKRRKL